MSKEFDEAVERLEEEADEKDIELDDDVFDEIESQFDSLQKTLRSIAERGLKGEFTEEFKKAEKEKARKEREGR